jgi:hypothetical protein
MLSGKVQFGKSQFICEYSGLPESFILMSQSHWFGSLKQAASIRDALPAIIL